MRPSPRAMFNRVRWRSPITVSIAIAIVVNLVLLGAWAWSRGGQTTNLRVETEGDTIRVWVNGREYLTGRYPDAAAEGKLILNLEPTNPITSLPQPQGIDYVKVSDLETGEVLFEDNFSEGESFIDPPVDTDWVSPSEAMTVEKGHLVAIDNPGTLTLEGRSFEDVRVDIEYDNPTGMGVMLRALDARNGLRFEMRPFRHYDSRIEIVQEGAATGLLGERAEMPRDEVIKSMVATALSFYPEIFLLLLAGLAVVAVVQFVPRISVGVPQGVRRRVEGRPVSAAAVTVAVAGIAAFAFAVTQFLLYDYGANMAHIPDEVSYMFQAKLLASGRLQAPAPPVEVSFDYFMPALILEHDGHWISVYPFGHPILLAIGERFGVMHVIPPLIGALSVVATFFIGRVLYNARTGLLAAAILACSPFFLMTASNFMSHNTAALYLCGSLLFLAVRDRRPALFPLLAGVFFGLLFNTRPLTALGLVPAFGGLLLFLLWSGRARWKDELRMDAAFVAGGLLMLVAYGLYNWGTTGNPLQGQYQASADVSEVIGFGGRHSVAIGIQNEQVQLAMLVMVLNNWPAWLGLGMILLPFILGTRRIWDWFLLAGAVSVMGIYTLYEAPGIAHGPRYWYDAMPFFVLLAARGADRAAGVLATIAGWMRQALTGVDRRPTWVGVAVVYSFVLFFVIAGTREWLVGDGADWNVDQMPNQAKALKGYNGANDNLTRVIDDADLENALVLLETCPSWQCYGVAFSHNTPDLDGDIVYAKDIPERNQEVFAKYPDRQVYQGVYRSAELRPYGTTSGSVAAQDLEDAPLATAVPSPTPQPTPTPDVAAVARRDEKRRGDLDLIADALQDYFDRNGSYPLSPGVTSLCVYSWDVGCAVKDVLEPLPNDPVTGQFYWYQSDGETFFNVFAKMEADPGPSECADPPPEHLANVTFLYCARGP